jgi:hypothetical protein
MAKGFKGELRRARTRLQAMVAECEALQTRIARQKRIVAGLTQLVGLDNDVDPPTGLVEGITDACRTVLRGAEKPLYPVEVRERILALGIPNRGQVLSSVYITLKRLKNSKEVRTIQDRDGTGATQDAYEWIRLADRVGVDGKE